MEHYVIIGNGVAGVEAALTLRERYRPERAAITIISKESDYFFSRTALMYAYMEQLQRRDLEPYERGMWAKQRIALVRDEVIDLDAQARQVTLRAGGPLGYDKLLLAVGASPRALDFQGAQTLKEGLVHFVSMQDLEECERLTWTTREAVVVGGGLIGVELVECLRHHGAQVSFLIREPWYWPAALCREEGEHVMAHMRAHGVDVRPQTQLEAASADEQGRVREVTTSRGDALPCQLLGVCVGVAPSIGWLQGVKTPPAMERGITVDRAFATSLEGVWAAGDCVQIDQGPDQPALTETIWYAAKRHGRLAAQSMMGDQVSYSSPLFYNSSKFFEIEYTTVGKVTGLSAQERSIYRRSPDRDVSVRVVVDERDQVIGFNMLGSRWNHRLLMRWILERRTWAEVEPWLPQAQFDVEFGRVKLSTLQHAEVSA